MAKMLYKVGSKKVGIGGKRKGYVARPYYATKQNELDIIRQVARNYGGVNEGEVYAVLQALANAFEDTLFHGHPVKLPGFGTFRISFSSRSHPTPGAVSADDISDPRIIFTPDPRLRKILKEQTTFEPAEREDGA